MVINIDSHKLMYHPERVTEWKETGDCYPIYVEVGPTNICNHKCIFCALDFVEHGNHTIDKDIMISALKDMAKHGIKSVMFAGEGEPLLHKDICLFVQKAKEYGMDVSITTNGVLFTKEKIEKYLPYLTWIRFSVDAGSAKTYSEIHKTKKEDFNKLIKNIKVAVEFKRKNKLKTTIGIQFLLIPQNIKEVIKFAKLFKKIRVDNIQIKPYSQHPKSINKFVIKYGDYAYLEEPLKKLNSDKFKVFFRGETMKRIEDKNPYSECFGLPFFALINSKGDIIPCNLFYDSKRFVYGNLYKNNFSEIWNSQQRQRVLKILRRIGCEHCRGGCRLDVINRYLNRIKQPEEHDNFI